MLRDERNSQLVKFAIRNNETGTKQLLAANHPDININYLYGYKVKRVLQKPSETEVEENTLYLIPARVDEKGYSGVEFCGLRFKNNKWQLDSFTKYFQYPNQRDSILDLKDYHAISEILNSEGWPPLESTALDHAVKHACTTRFGETTVDSESRNLMWILLNKNADPTIKNILNEVPIERALWALKQNDDWRYNKWASWQAIETFIIGAKVDVNHAIAAGYDKVLDVVLQFSTVEQKHSEYINQRKEHIIELLATRLPTTEIVTRLKKLLEEFSLEKLNAIKLLAKSLPPKDIGTIILYALCFSSSRQHHIAIIKTLLENVEEKNKATVLACTDQRGYTALHYACNNEDLELIKLLLKHAVDEKDLLNAALLKFFEQAFINEEKPEDKAKIIKGLLGNPNFAWVDRLTLFKIYKLCLEQFLIPNKEESKNISYSIISDACTAKIYLSSLSTSSSQPNQDTDRAYQATMAVIQQVIECHLERVLSEIVSQLPPIASPGDLDKIKNFDHSLIKELSSQLQKLKKTDPQFNIDTFYANFLTWMKVLLQGYLAQGNLEGEDIKNIYKATSLEVLNTELEKIFKNPAQYPIQSPLIDFLKHIQEIIKGFTLKGSMLNVLTDFGSRLSGSVSSIFAFSQNSANNNSGSTSASTLPATYSEKKLDGQLTYFSSNNSGGKEPATPVLVETPREKLVRLLSNLEPGKQEELKKLMPKTAFCHLTKELMNNIVLVMVENKAFFCERDAAINQGYRSFIESPTIDTIKEDIQAGFERIEKSLCQPSAALLSEGQPPYLASPRSNFGYN